jgi:hypothetical protein
MAWFQTGQTDGRQNQRSGYFSKRRSDAAASAGAGCAHQVTSWGEIDHQGERDDLGVVGKLGELTKDPRFKQQRLVADAGEAVEVVGAGPQAGDGRRVLHGPDPRPSRHPRHRPPPTRPDRETPSPARIAPQRPTPAPALPAPRSRIDTLLCSASGAEGESSGRHPSASGSHPSPPARRIKPAHFAASKLDTTPLLQGSHLRRRRRGESIRERSRARHSAAGSYARPGASLPATSSASTNTLRDAAHRSRAERPRGCEVLGMSDVH